MGFFANIFKKKQKPASSKINRNNLKIGLALSGGGTKGFAHIGVLRCFEEVGIKFDFVAGTSIGSFVGAIYAAGFDTASMEQLGRTIKESDIKNSKIIISPSKSSNIADSVRRCCGNMTFADLKIPFVCCATDMLTGEEVVLSSGDVARAVAASCSAPVFFDGVDIDGKHLVDGGLTNNLPADIVRNMGADIVVSVTLSNVGSTGTDSKNILSVLMATLAITMKSTSLKGKLNSDIIISPNMEGKKSTKIQNISELIDLGYEAAKDALPQLYELIGTPTEQVSTQPNKKKVKEKKLSKKPSKVESNPKV